MSIRSISISSPSCFFFFQAEDGIRDYKVTGVQTCALPIWFARAIDVWGADHHGYVPRVRAALRALGYGDDFLHVQIVQLVRVMRGGEEVRFSKRTGEFVTLRDLFQETGVDAARYFFLMRRGDAQFVFDVDLAKSQTEENPVFYVQMAHARMSGIFRVAAREPAQVTVDGVDLEI